VHRADREARLQRARAIGRIAYRLARDAKIEGFIEIDDGRKLIRECSRGRLTIALYAAANEPPSETDFSELRVRYAGRKVFVIRWNLAGAFNVVAFEPGDWEQTFQRP
jgi:hypothetical protein